MWLKLYRDDHITAWHVYIENPTNFQSFIGYMHYIKELNEFRFSLSGPIGTHQKAQKLGMKYLNDLADKILLE